MDIVHHSFLLPVLKLDDQKFEFVFLLDHSGSMADRPIALAKTALKLILHSLPATFYFNIIGFNHSFKPMFPESVAYSQTTLDDAKNKINDFKSYGQTEILPALQFVYKKPQIPGYLMQIFSITDGYVSNRDAVLNLVASNVKHCRSYSIGIGQSVDTDLVKGIAENGGGHYEFVSYDESIESKVLKQLQLAQKPGLLKPVRVTKRKV